MRTRTAGAVLSVLLLAFPAGGEQLTMGRSVELGAIGIRFSPIEQISMLPRPTPSMASFTESSSGHSFHAVKLEDAWRADQLRALFTNKVGRVRVAEMRFLPPAGLTDLGDGYVPLAAYRESAEAAAAPADEAGIQQWIESFTGREVEGHESISRSRSLRYPCREYKLGGNGTVTRAFLMKVKFTRTSRYVLFTFEFPPLHGFENIDAAIYRCLRSVTTSTVRTTDKRADLKRQNFSALAEDDDASPEFLETKRRVIDNINALDEWWYVEMPHYILVSNLTRNNRFLVERIQQNIERLREAFQVLVPPVSEIDEVSVVRVFNTRDEYLDYVGSEHRWTVGVWMPGKRELVISPHGQGSRSASSSKIRQEILNTAYHEAFHQYIFYALDRIEVPIWLNEGHACLFEAAEFSRSRETVTIEENEERLKTLAYTRRVGQEVDLMELFSMTREQFYVQGVEEEGADVLRAHYYAASWAVTYFLRKGAAVAFPGKGYEDICSRWVDYLVEHPGADTDALEHALSGVDREQLQKDYDRFWLEKSMRKLARKNRLFSDSSSG